VWQLRIVRTGGCWRNMALRAPRGACNNYYYYYSLLSNIKAARRMSKALLKRCCPFLQPVTQHLRDDRAATNQ